jgi:hypothetical protein
MLAAAQHQLYEGAGTVDADIKINLNYSGFQSLSRDKMLKKLLLFAVLVALVSCTNPAYKGEIPVISVDSREFIRDWVLCGPFPNPLAEGVGEYLHDETTLGFYIDYLESAGGENGIVPRPGLKIQGTDNQTRRWFQHNSTKDLVDFTQQFDKKLGVVCYAACYLESDKAQRIMLGLGSNDGVRAWLNGEMIWDHHRSRGASKDNDWLWADVKEGKNLLLLKIDQGLGSWGLYARVVDSEEKIKAAKELFSPDLLVEKKVSESEIEINIGRSSRIMILDQKQTYTTKLINSAGNVLAIKTAQLGEAVTISWKEQPNGPYWIKSQANLPSGKKHLETVFVFKGQSNLNVKLYGRDGNNVDFIPLVEMLDQDFNKLDKAVKNNLDGTFSLLRPDVSPFYLQVLLDAQDLGRRWYLLDNGGAGFKVPKDNRLDLDLPVEAAKSLWQSTLKVAKDESSPQWLRENLQARLGGITEKVIKEKPYFVLDRLFTLKSKLTISNGADVWFAPSIEKVALNEATPEFELPGVNLSLARHEYEPFQIVVRPEKKLTHVNVKVSELRNVNGQSIKSDNITVQVVDYIKVTETTDVVGTKDWWPDALPDLKEPVSLSANQNQPFWITVYAPKDQVAGVYNGVIKITSNDKTIAETPLTVQVFNFTLPDETHTETAYGVGVNAEYHGPLSDEQKKETHDLYMQFCAKRRISPYAPHAYSPIKWEFVGKPAQVKIDYSDFDKAMSRYIDDFHFNSYRISGLPGELNGHKRYTPEYNRLFKLIYGQVQEHLRDKGWLDEVYWYWVDEPPIPSYPDIMPGFKLLKEACPDMRRMLTVNNEDAPAPYFYDAVNYWVPIFDRYNHERSVARQKLGETVGWYVCTGPKAPYPNNFIDNPAINHRVRSWMIDKFQVDGSLYWSVTWWGQNPWKQAMSVNYEGGNWGNGDGRLLYPPQRDKPKEALVAPPVTSIRFENLRDGLEDAEYLVKLRDSKKASANKVLESTEDVLVKTLSCYEQNPFIFLNARYKVAKSVEQAAK